MQTLRALYDLSRPANGLITALSVGVGGLCSQGPMIADAVLLAALSAACINAAGNAFNDLLDVDIDRVNRPERPLPSQRITLPTAAAFTAFCSLFGIWLGYAVSPQHALWAAGISVLLALYSLFLKTSVLWGNGLVGLIAAAAFPYGALTCGSVGRAWIPGIFALLFHLGREIVKDVEDRSGDRLRGDRTLPLRYGTRTATGIVTGIFALLMVFTLLPYFYSLYGKLYLLGVFAVHVLLLYVLYVLYAAGEAPSDGRLGRLLKVGMLAGLVAVVAGEWMRSL
ncbi:MAG: geranylgeranylglycerol-phosphate geranylgeranyltransferase [Candidatus Latescibacterota bacterium]